MRCTLPLRPPRLPLRPPLRPPLLPGLLLLLAGCTFAPDLSRFSHLPACREDGSCEEAGAVCLPAVSRCLPACGDGPDCVPPEPDAGAADAGAADAGGDDAGTAAAPLTLSQDALPPASEGLPYARPLEARGGTPPYRFSPLGPLPADLSLAGDGTLTGTPQGFGLRQLPVEVRDAAVPPQVVQRTLALEVVPALSLRGPAQPAQARDTFDYEEQLLALGGTPPLHYALAPGSAPLPPGLTLLGTGRLTGRPTSAGSRTVRVRVEDGATPPRADELSLTLAVADPPGLLGGVPLGITTQALPAGRAGLDYRYTLRAEAGNPPYLWGHLANVPPGLFLEPSTGLLSGTPTTPGTWSFTVRVSDARDGTHERPFTLRVD